MDANLIKYYENRLGMMGSPAWGDFMEDVDAMLQSTNDISSIQDEQTLHFRRGEISIMRWLLALKDVSEQAYEELKEEDK